MRIEATDRFVLGSTAVAVCVLLCGSTPMTIIAAVSSRCAGGGEPRLTIRLRESSGHLVITPLLSQAADGRRAE